MKRTYFFISFFIAICSVFKVSQASTCIAHRGDNKYQTENTWNSIKSALRKNADGIEMDIHHTKDNEAIIFHDKRLRRLMVNRKGRNCPRYKKIKKLSLKTIQDNCIYKDGQEILTLKQYLKNTQDRDIYHFFEFKDVPHIKTLNLIKSKILNYEKVKFISFKSKALKETYKHFKSITKRNSNYLKLYYFWLPNHPKWTPNYPLRSWWIFSSRLLELKKYYSLGIWVIDDEMTLRWAIANNISYITTNDPGLCYQLTRQAY